MINECLARLAELLRCEPCKRRHDARRKKIGIIFERQDTTGRTFDMSDTTFASNQTEVATPIIVDGAGAPVAGATFDAGTTVTWTLADTSVAQLVSINPDNTATIKAIAAGAAALAVTGTYKGNIILGSANITITQAAEVFAINITWSAPTASQAPAPVVAAVAPATPANPLGLPTR